MTRIPGSLVTLATAAAAAIGTAAQAQSWPVRPVRFVVPFAAGGSTDIVGRTIAQKLAEPLGQPVVVDNRPGGSTQIGTDVVAKSPGDGYTFLVVPAPFTINPTLFGKLPYDAFTDFTPVMLINTTPLVLVVNPRVPAGSVRELTSLVRARPGTLNFGSSGTGGSNHLAGELYKSMAGLKIVHVPYKGNAPALTDLVGGHVDLVFNGLTSAIALIRGGKLKALAVTSAKRSSVLPELPTMDEAGLKGFEATAWNGLAGPARVPREIVTRLQAEVVKILGNPEVRDRLRADGSDPVGSTPDEFARYLRTETEKWAKVIRFAGVKPE